MRSEINHGLLAGAGIALWYTLAFALGLHTKHLALGEYSGHVADVILVVVLWRLLRARQREFGPLFNLRRGLWPAMLASLVASLVVYCFLVAYNHWINPHWLDNAMQWKVDRLREAGVSEPDIRAEIEFYRTANTPVGLLRTTVLGTTLLGGLVAFVLTLVLIWRGIREEKTAA
jgi:hypothetical protein